MVRLSPIFNIFFLFFFLTGNAQETLPAYVAKTISLANQDDFKKVYNFNIEHQNAQGISTDRVGYIISLPIQIPIEGARPFTAFSMTWEAMDELDLLHLHLKHSTNNQDWSNWEVIEKDIHVDNKNGKNTSQLVFLDPEVTSVKFMFWTEKGFQNPIQNIKLHFYNPQNSLPLLSNPTAPTFRDACACTTPDFVSREDWCPVPLNCPTNPSPSATTTTHLIIHHSATSNSPSDWPAVVRSIWNQHVNVNGWSDVGYNWLVDPDGNLYEGRGRDIQGAHFCGTNSGTTGVCMLGNFSTNLPSTEAVDKLTQFLAWNACNYDLDPLAAANHPGSNLNLNHISGHRDGCATECPGNTFYPTISNLRQDVADYIVEKCSSVTNTYDPATSTENISLLPNPTTGFVTFQHEFASPSTLTLFAMNGQKVLVDKTISQSNELQIGHLENGIYILQLETAEGLFSRKLVLQKK